MLTLFCLYVNRIPILLNHVIRYPILPDKFGDKPDQRKNLRDFHFMHII